MSSTHTAEPVPVPEPVSPDVLITHRLPLPSQVVRGQVLWLYAIPIATIHLLALGVVFPYFFSWTGVVVCLLGVHVFGQGINVCYHRLLTHRSFQVPLWLEHFMVLVALCCLQDTPGRWVATHRFHHNHSDEQPDPHTPLVNFLWSHVGWLFVHNPETHSLVTYQKYARDILADPFYMKLEKSTVLTLYFYLAHAALFFAAGFGLGFALGDTAAAGLQMGLSLFFWGVLLRTVIVWHITWSVNSLTHLFGYRTYATGENSRNNWFVALITVGEGWHNNHHHDPASASVQHRWWEVDISYYEIRLLELLGLAKDVIRPRHVRHAHREKKD
jgi:fatty-acid desaturase